MYSKTFNVNLANIKLINLVTAIKAINTNILQSNYIIDKYLQNIVKLGKYAGEGIQLYLSSVCTHIVLLITKFF